MKYENFEKVKVIVKKIQNYEEKLHILQSHPAVIIKSRHNGDAIELSTFVPMGSEGTITCEFIETFIQNIKDKITSYKIQLGNL